MHKRASQKTSTRDEFGWMSEIEGIVADKPRKIRGDRTDILLYEEAGSFNALIKGWIQGNPLVTLNGVKFGIKIGWGTGGDTGDYVSGLRKMFFSPKAYGILPYRHNCTNTGDYVLTAYFIPVYSIVNVPGYMDERGVTDLVRGREYYQAIRDSLLEDPEAYQIECAEHCFTPEEALSLEGNSPFDRELLTAQKAEIELFKSGPRPIPKRLDYKFAGQHEESNILGIESKYDKTSKLLILEDPLKDDTGKVYDNLYVGGIDSIDIGGKDTSDQTKEPSDFCIVICKRIKGMDEPMPVAIYKDRPHDIRDAYKISIKLLEYYNCKAVLESSKVGLLQYFREKKKEHLLFKRPRATLSPGTKNTKLIGATATETVIKHQLELIDIYIKDYAHNIWFIDMIDEALTYSYQNKRKFDIIAAWGMAMLGDEELQGYMPVEQNRYQEEYQPIGYYIDDKGRRQYGIKPKPMQTLVNFNYDHALVRN